jgi:hypothetical protein
MCDRLPLSLFLVVFSLSLSTLPLRVLLLWSVGKRRRKNAYILIEKEREKKIRDWSSPMIGRELIVLCNFWTNNIWRERERNIKTSIARDFLFTLSKHLLTFTEYKREKKKEIYLSPVSSASFINAGDR